MNYTLAYGFNTKQWWVYNYDKDVWIDPPSAVLDSLPADLDAAEEKLDAIVMEDPEWLYETGFWYNANMDI